MNNITRRFKNHLPFWKRHLKGFYNYNYVLNGLSDGFRIGIDPERAQFEHLISDKPHYIELNIHEKRAVSGLISKGLDRGFISGPYTSPNELPFSHLYCAPIFVVPKPGINNYRPIVHLSWNEFNSMLSINDLLCEYMKHIQYISFRETVNMVNNAGLGAYIMLLDAQDAYYRVPIHPDDWKYNGLKWGKLFWVFTSLQMGLSSSPRIYTLFADAVEYICVKKFSNLLFCNGMQMLRHYIDDFFAIVRCLKDANTVYKGIFDTFHDLGIPTRWDKCEPPNIQNKILGWIYHTVRRIVQLPSDKRKKILELIEPILAKKCSNRKTLERLIGRLQNASMVIFPGKAFVRRLEAVLYLTKFEYNEKIPISDFVLDDLRWWRKIISNADKCSASFDLILKLPSDGDFHLFTDATTTLGFGGHCSDAGFQVDWKDTVKAQLEKSHGAFDISTLELLVSIVGMTVFADKFQNKAVTIHNDNPTASKAIHSKAPPLRRMDLQFLIRQLATSATDSQYYFWGEHTIAKESPEMQLADALSRLESKKACFDKGNLKFDFSAKARDICNLLLQEIVKYPILASQPDIPRSRRREFGILLDDDVLTHNPNWDLVLLKQKMYNILYKRQF